MSAHLLPNESEQEPLPVIVLMPWWGRAILVTLTAFVVLVFAVAIYLDPYEDDGTPRRMETHRQLGLPPCTFKLATNLPCPSCGMTTSFSLLIRGDVRNSLWANAAGTLLGVLCLLFVPWALITAWRGHLLFLRSLERTLIRLVVVFLIVMMLRWAIVLLVFYT